MVYCWVSQRRMPFVKCGHLIKLDLQKREKRTDMKDPLKGDSGFIFLMGIMEQLGEGSRMH